MGEDTNTTTPSHSSSLPHDSSSQLSSQTSSTFPQPSHHTSSGRGRTRGRRGRGRGRGRGDRRDGSDGERIRAPNLSATTEPPTADLTHSVDSEGPLHQQAGRKIPRSRRGRGRGGGRGGGGRSGAAGAKGNTGTMKSSAPQHGDEDEEQPLCVVCAEELKFFAVGECNHSGRCSMCAVRSRVLLKDRSCPECKTVHDRLVVAELPPDGVAPRFESFNLWGDHGGPDAVFDEASEMVFHSCQEHYRFISRATGLYCPIGGCRGAIAADEDPGSKKQGSRGKAEEPFPDKAALLEHVKERHRKLFCELCLENRPLFLSEQEVFVSSALRKHEIQVNGHPLCRFCSRRFFDDTALYDHMTGTHINCHLCPEENQHRYFRGEPQLRDHLRSSHFLCDRGGCTQRGAISAFNTAQELQAHLSTEHGVTGRRAAVGFNVRRSARDGTGIEVTEDDLATAHGFAGGAEEGSHFPAAGELIVAPDPDSDLASGIVVPVPSNRGRNTRRNIVSDGRTGGHLAPGGWGTSSPSEGEAFPSLPAPPPAPSQGLHSFSLVGRARPQRPGAGGASSARGGSTVGTTDGARRLTSEDEENEKRLLMRNKRVAEALGIRAALGAGASIGGAKVGTNSDGAAIAVGIGDGLDTIREHLARTNYTKDLVAWARTQPSELAKVERRLADLVNDPKGTSTQFRPMPSITRRFVHELAAYYGLVTRSYDVEPKRYVSAIKQKGYHIPTRLLSFAARDPNYKGTDEASPDASTAQGLQPPSISNTRAAALQQAVGPSPTTSQVSAPRVSMVTSIPSTSSGLHVVAAVGGKSGSAFDHQNGAESSTGVSTASTSLPVALTGPSPQTMLIVHSLKHGLSSQMVLEAIRTVVPPRTVVRVRPAKTAEGDGSGSGGGALVAEFTSALNARRALEKIEKGAEELIAAAQVTRTAYDIPFRARPYPEGSTSSGAGEQRRADGAGAGAGAVDAPSQDEDSVRDNWDSSEDGDDLDEKQNHPDEQFSESETSRENKKALEKADDKEVPPVAASHLPLGQGGGETDVSNAVADDDLAVGDGGGAGDKNSSDLVAGHNETDRGVRFSSQGCSSSLGPQRHPKWGNSVIRGRLSRPTDGRIPTADINAQERLERIAELRRLEKHRCKSRAKREQAKRAERADVGKLDAHATMWADLRDSSSASETEDEEHEEHEAMVACSVGRDEGGVTNQRQKSDVDVEGRGVCDVEVKFPAISGAREPLVDEISIEGGVCADGAQRQQRNEVGNVRGWACEICTFWNDAREMGSDPDSCDAPRCEMCNGEGPKNASSPWMTV